MGQILKIALGPATLLWGAFSYNYYKCDVKGFCGESVAQVEDKDKSLPGSTPSDQIKDGENPSKMGEAYDQNTNNAEEAWAHKNIDAFQAKANQ